MCHRNHNYHSACTLYAHRVVCMSCRRVTPRAAFQRVLADLNPAADAAARAFAQQRTAQRAPLPTPGVEALVRRPDGDVELPVRRPDGDVELVDAASMFVVPPCDACGGVLKPHVVFFGDGVDRDVAQRALDIASACDALLVVGSSLAVYSAFRLVKGARERGATVAAVTLGATRADDMLALTVPARAGEALSRLDRLLMLPRG